MKIFDGHCHIETGWQKYDIEAQKNVIFNSFESYHKHVAQVAPTDTVTLIFDYRQHFDEVKQLLAEKKIAALKIHSRIQRLAAADYPEMIDSLARLQPDVPIIYDAFYFGDDIDYQPSLENAVYIAKKFTHLPVIIAHSGGIEILRYFYHLKSLDNIYFDLSLGLAYLKHTSVFLDYTNLVRFGNPDKILFGTDYPFVSPKAQLDTFTEVAEDLKLPAETVEKILYTNAQKIFLKK